jgi:hypothetical protein
LIQQIPIIILVIMPVLKEKLLFAMPAVLALLFGINIMKSVARVFVAMKILCRFPVARIAVLVYLIGIIMGIRLIADCGQWVEAAYFILVNVVMKHKLTTGLGYIPGESGMAA